jgi:hypothetical protein
MKTVIFKDYSEFLNRTDKSVNGVSVAFAEQNPEYKEQNQTNQGCWNCMGCSDCIDCRGCSDCSYCMGCRGCSDCSYCMGCSDCSDCSNFNYNPQRIISPVIGSRNDQTTYITSHQTMGRLYVAALRDQWRNLKRLSIITTGIMSMAKHTDIGFKQSDSM